MTALTLKSCGETSLTLQWAPLSPLPTSLALEYRHVPAAWGSSPQLPLLPSATSATLECLLPTATYECRLVSGGAVVVTAVAFDTLPAGCGGSDGKKKGACVVT